MSTIFGVRVVVLLLAATTSTLPLLDRPFLQPPAVLTMHLPPIFSIVLPLATALVGIFTYNHGTASIFRCPGFLNPFHSPHHSSWNTWFHPFQSLPLAEAGSRKKGWNILYHLGGNGPWIEKIDGDSESLGIAPPEGCLVDQVHMVCTSSQQELFE